MGAELFEVQMRVAEMALAVMQRGLRVDLARLRALRAQVEEMCAARRVLVEELIGCALPTNKAGNVPFFNSNKQIGAWMAAQDLKGRQKRGAQALSWDDAALEQVAAKHPHLKAVCFAIIEYRSLEKARATFLEAKREPGGRLRTSFNSAGPETFRWSSSTNPFYRGCNLQNIMSDVHRTTGAAMPNFRSAIVPDPGHVLLEPDLKGADAQVVAWDSGDAVLKDMCKQGVKIAAERAKLLYGGDAGPDGKREPYYTRAKMGGHAWTYGAKANTLAAACGLTRQEAQQFVRRLEGVHPGIVAWQRRVAEQLARDGTIWNAFGYRIVYFDRPDACLTKALAWIGQGTVACVVNRVGLRLWQDVPEGELLLNNHDSWVLQCRREDKQHVKKRVLEAYRSVVVPYEEPLCIPPDLKTSEQSWGEMVREEW